MSKLVKNLALPSFDLSGIMEQLKADPQHADWSAEKLQQAELEYRQYMALCRSNPGQSVMPTRLGDAVWHFHILNTRKYTEDCRNYLGYFLHHQPTTPSHEIIEASHRLFGELVEGEIGTQERYVVMCYCTDGPASSLEDRVREAVFLHGLPV